MANKKIEDYKELGNQELLEKIEEAKLQYKKKKFAHAVSTLENPLELRWMRREIARLNTEYRRRQLEDQNK